MTNQSYAQVTIACNTVKSPILHSANLADKTQADILKGNATAQIFQLSNLPILGGITPLTFVVPTSDFTFGSSGQLLAGE